jgi:Zn-dependent protease
MIPFGSFRIGRILGIDVEINYTWFLIFILVTISFSFVFRQKPFSIPLSLGIILAIATSFLFFGSVLLHEISHSFIAKRNKINIKKITLFIFGGVAQMTEEPSTPQTEFKMAIAGPLMSLFLSLFFGSFWLLSYVLNLGVGFSAPFEMLSQINLGLAIFNLLPGFPLDGGRVVRAGLWYFLNDLRKATRIASYGGQAVAFFLIFVGFVGFITNFGFGALWLVLIGWFLNHAAQSGYRQMELQYALSDVKVEEIMVKDVVTINPDLPLDQLVDEYFLRYKFGRFPVVDKGTLIGVVTLHDVKEIPREEWPINTARQITTFLDKDIQITPEAEVFKALMKMAKEELGHLLVVKDGNLVGLITKSDIMRLIRVRTELSM